MDDGSASVMRLAHHEKYRHQSLIIGGLLATTIFLGVAATGVNDKWDDKQEWIEADCDALKAMGDIGTVKHFGQIVHKSIKGWQPHTDIMYRKRIK